MKEQMFLQYLLFGLVTGNFYATASPQRNNQEYCYNTDRIPSQLLYLGTKTPYQLAKGSQNDAHYVLPNCKPSKFWMLGRHGTRLSKDKNIAEYMSLELLRDEIIKNYEERSMKSATGALCDGDLELLKNWHWDRNITADKTEYLTVQGWNDLKLIASNYKHMYPELFESNYTEQNYLFKHTKTQRTEASYKAFVEGLFGENSYQYVKADALGKENSLLYPYLRCQTWKDNHKKNEMKKFGKSAIFTQLINDVSTRLGFEKSLTLEQITNIYQMCRYTVAWYIDKPSPWCSAFTPKQISILEYWEDIESYYETGYGTPVNQQIECEMVQDMLKHMKTKDVPKVVAYFAHSVTIRLFLTSLGIGKPQVPLTADNYENMKNRKYRSSQLAPFASNLVAIKYVCSEELKTETKIMFFLNEKPVDFDWCKDGFCNWTDVQETYKHFINADCSEIFCTDPDKKNYSHSIKISSSILNLILMIIVPFMKILNVNF